ncbi:MAG: glutamine synthetase III [Clostridia bacterium]
MFDIADHFGEMVFNDQVMKQRLPEEIYNSLKDTIRKSLPLAPHTAGIVASAMKDWAIEKGATHYTHWFQPLTGVTAEKHDSFISPIEGGAATSEFSGKELIMGEPDASSFPSGGLRPTFEARGYTAWDPTSYAFIKDHVLYIPTVFCSYSGDALDKKTPLLRSMDLISRESCRILRLFGHNDVNRVIPCVGSEQEYFLVEKSLFDKRRDLLFCSRTLFGAKPPKGQELDDHYYGTIQPRVSDFMRELNRELWRLGVYAKTEHKEVAPGQYELAPIYTDANTATDHNQLTMELMKKIALKHDLVCLLHEKPFMRLNGSGKHNNWSLSTDTGVNLLHPGKSPQDDLQFLLFICAVIKAVDEYSDLLRVCVASASNDCRLGGQEAPPAVVSIFMGEDLTGLLSSIENDDDYACSTARMLESGASVVPRLRIDTTDRNRTSPLAFTGNKFEFRMLGSGQSIADTNTVLNTIVAQALGEFADELEGKDDDMRSATLKLLRRTLHEHKRILYSGNGYSEEWAAEAKARGLVALPTTVDALPCFIDKKNIDLFTRHGIFTEREIRSRYDVSLENYVKVISIEAKTMLEMSHRDILPSVFAYQKELADTIASKSSLKLSTLPESGLLERLCGLSDKVYAAGIALDSALDIVKAADGMLGAGIACKTHVLPVMSELREAADKLEVITAKAYWPFPTYEDLLFRL